MISATDVLHTDDLSSFFLNKLVFVGTTATGSGEVFPTAISPVFLGVEIWATIAQSILDQYLPYKPGWAKGVCVASILIFGLSLSLLLPYLGALGMVFTSSGIIAFLFFLQNLLWTKEQIFISFFFPSLTLALVALFHLIYGFFMERRQKRMLREVFGAYVSPEHIDMIIQEKGTLNLLGEKKELSVLFSDIREFTSRAEEMSPIEVRDFLNSYFTEVTEAIFEQKGTIDKYIGDAVMAFWGAPLSDEQHALHAVQTGFSMLEHVKKQNKLLAAQKKQEFHIGIGIASGPMFVGDMGSKYRLAFTVLGDTVNLASRLESLTKYYGVDMIVSEQTYQMTKEVIIHQILDIVMVKGRHKENTIYRPLCLLTEKTTAIEEERSLHERAFEAYKQGNWDEARDLWRQAKEKSMNQKIYEVYIARIGNRSAPETGWSYIQKFEEK